MCSLLFSVLVTKFIINYYYYYCYYNYYCFISLSEGHKTHRETDE